MCESCYVVEQCPIEHANKARCRFSQNDASESTKHESLEERKETAKRTQTEYGNDENHPYIHTQDYRETIKDWGPVNCRIKKQQKCEPKMHVKMKKWANVLGRNHWPFSAKQMPIKGNWNWKWMTWFAKMRLTESKKNNCRFQATH